MLTPSGASFLWELVAADLVDGSITVRSADGKSAEAPITSVDVTANRIEVVAAFPDGEANFDWASRDIVASDGTVLDTKREDLGRKAPGAEWTLAASIEFAVTE